MDMEKDSSDGCLPQNMSDSGNRANDITIELESDFKIKDINIIGTMKLIFLASCLIGIGYCVITSNIAGVLISCMAMVFIMDMMGMLDSLKKARRDMTKPGGYENIE